MSHFSPDEQRFLRRIVRKVVERIAPKELPLFEELADEYFRNPALPTRDKWDLDEPLGSGLSDLITASTKITLALGSTALSYMQQPDDSYPDMSGSAPPTMIRRVLHDHDQREQLVELVYQSGRTLRLPPEKAAQIVETLIRALEEVDAEQSGQQRVINAWIADQASGMPLQLEQTYQLCFNVDLPRTDALATAGQVDELTAALPPDQPFIELIVFLDADAAALRILGPNPQALRVPRVGPSATTTFAIQPRQTSRHRITVLLALHNQIFQRMEIEVDVGSSPIRDAPGQVQVRGQSLAQALQQATPLHSMSLVITTCLRGYQFLLLFDNWYRQPVIIDLTESEITALVRQAREELQERILNKIAGQERVYQREDTSIPREIHEQALHELAQIGHYLYKKLFYSGRSEDVRALGDLLRREMRRHQFQIDVVAVDNAFIFPWAWLYLGEQHEPIDPEAFWGFKHLIACKPGTNEASNLQLDPELAAEPLQLGYIYNAGAGARPERQRMARRQREVLQQLPNVALSDYVDCQALLNLLNDPDAAPHILYFYCHDVRRNTTNPAALYQSELALTDGVVTIGDLDRLTDAPLKQAPLVFLNACNSARLNPHGSDGLVPYMIKRGARGVLGTEVEVPVYFSAEFGQELLARLIRGTATLGEIMLQLRREFLFERHNLLGLLYTAYCNNDLRVKERRRR